MEFRITHKQAFWMLALILSTAFLMQMVVGMGYVNTFDTYWYRDWALDLPNGLFTVYEKSRMENIQLDYPPLYLICLYFTGLGYRVLGENCHICLQMFLLKFWPVVFNVACAALLYYICRNRYGRVIGLTAAFLWCLNPAFFLNAVMWGQTDSTMAFCLLLAFWLLEQNRTVAACVAFAVAGLTKFQSLFFTPPFLLTLLFRNLKDWKRIVKGLAAAAVTVAVVFIPFMIGARNPLLFFDVYLGSAGKYPYCSLHAYNIYCLLDLNWTTGVMDTDPIVGGFTWYHFGMICAFLSVALVVALYILSYCKSGRERLSGWVGGLLMMQCLFMFMTRMHERYQVIVVPFALMAWITTRNKRFLGLFGALSGFTFINQAMVLIRNVVHSQRDVWAFWEPYRSTVEMVLSFINLLLFIWCAYECIRYFLGGKPAKEKNWRPYDDAGPENPDARESAIFTEDAPAGEDKIPAGGRKAERSHGAWIRI